MVGPGPGPPTVLMCFCDVIWTESGGKTLGVRGPCNIVHAPVGDQVCTALARSRDTGCVIYSLAREIYPQHILDIDQIAALSVACFSKHPQQQLQ